MDIKRGRRLLWLFGTNFWISALSFGGGYVVIPMVQRAFSEKRRYLTEEEVFELAAVAQSSPGAIAINLLALVGQRIMGVGGAVVSCLGAVTPPLVLLSVISSCYTAFSANRFVQAALRGMEAGVAALIVSVCIDMTRSVLKERQPLLSIMLPAAFAASFFFKVNAIVVILAAGLICVAVGCFGRYRERRKHEDS